MPDWDPASTLRPLNFNITIVPGTASIQNANAYYEVVLPSGRAVQLSRPLDLTQVQAIIDQTSQVIIGQLLQAEGLAAIWEPSP